MSASAAVPEDRKPVEVVPMHFQYVTGIGTIGTADGRVYITFIEEQPGETPGTTIPVVGAKLIMDIDKFADAVSEMLGVVADARRQRRHRSN